MLPYFLYLAVPGTDNMLLLYVSVELLFALRTEIHKHIC
jgi:hypothetical protein